MVASFSEKFLKVFPDGGEWGELQEWEETEDVVMKYGKVCYIKRRFRGGLGKLVTGKPLAKYS
jgi:hypothetical protein